MEQAIGWWDAWGYLVMVVVFAVMLLLVRRHPQATDTATEMLRAAEVARELAAAAEQLWLTGKLPRDERFDYVLTRLGELFPDIEPNQLVALVESAVYFLRLKQRAVTGQASSELRVLESGPKW